MKMLELRLNWLARLLWGLALVTLPVTSFRYFPFMGSETSVKPLALYPLALLLPVLFVAMARQKSKRSWIAVFVPLGLFLLVALAATFWGGLFAPLDLYRQTYWGRALRAWVTLFVGLVFLLCAFWMNRSEDDLRFTFKWLYVGLVLDLVWSLMQISSLYFLFPPKQMMSSWQALFSQRALVRSKRISGFAFEPSWLANQMVTIYMPWLFAAVLKGYRVFRHRWIEPVLLIATVVLILFTFSRSGLLLVILVSGLTLLLVGRAQILVGRDWFARPFKFKPGLRPHLAREWMLRIGIVLLLVGFLAGGWLYLSNRNYLTQLWRSGEDDPIAYAIDNFVGARLAYAWAGFETFQARPLTGVGLGASGLYMFQNFPDWSTTTVVEIAHQFSPMGHAYPNPKNLFIRLLAETGLVGFWLFVTFYLFVLGRIQTFIMSRQKFGQFLGTAGLFTWLAVIILGFVQDSFAMPNIWFGFGIVLGMGYSLMATTEKP